MDDGLRVSGKMPALRGQRFQFGWIIYNDAARLALGAAATRVGNCGAFGGAFGEAWGGRRGAGRKRLSAARPPTAIPPWQWREVLVENHPKANSSCAQRRSACRHRRAPAVMRWPLAGRLAPHFRSCAKIRGAAASLSTSWLRLRKARGGVGAEKLFPVWVACYLMGDDRNASQTTRSADIGT